MSSAVLRIQVATLASVPDGQSRTDGVPNQLVTLQSIGTGSTHLIRLWDVANPRLPGSSSLAPIVPALTPLGDGRTWTFTPPGGASGFGQSFGIELVVDQGLPTEVRTRRKYAIRTANAQIVLPLFGEGADREASLFNDGTLQVANSVDNEGGNWRGYHPRLLDWIGTVDNYYGQIWLVPFPASAPASMPSTTPTHVGTVRLLPGTLYAIGADVGDLANPAQPTVLTIRQQNNPSNVLATFTVSQLKVWTEQVPAGAAISGSPTIYEIYINSQNVAGQWACKGIRLSLR